MDTGFAIIAFAAQPVLFGKRYNPERLHRRTVFIACRQAQALFVKILIVPIMHAVAVETTVNKMMSAHIDFARYACAVADTVRLLRQAVSGFIPASAVPFYNALG